VKRIYLDDAGSAPVLSEVTEALRAVPEGNPSSLHAEGRAARSTIDRARDTAAQALGADRTEITFTSSGTEAVNLAILGAARRFTKRSLIVTWAAEHQAVLGAVRRLESEGHAVEVAGVDQNARADPDSIPRGAALVSIGLANNEVGTVQPVREVIARAHELGALVHVDACAGPRWISIPHGADLVSFSGHKLGAGCGGMLFVKTGVRLEPLLYGGPHEWGRRAGREEHALSDVAARRVSIVTSKETIPTLFGNSMRALRVTAERRPEFAFCTPPSARVTLTVTRKLEKPRQGSAELASQNTPSTSFVGVSAGKKLSVVTLIVGSHGPDEPVGTCDAALIKG
jgi:cysteine sulfinate desulfinase/cysteine desulfurase-like protein